MAVEECAEFIVAMKHLQRVRRIATLKTTAQLLPLIEEIADVEIAVEQMRCMFDPGLIDTVKRRKLSRLAESVGLVDIPFSG